MFSIVSNPGAMQWGRSQESEIRSQKAQGKRQRPGRTQEGSGSVEVELLHFVAQGVAGDPQHHGGAGLIAAGFFQCLSKQSLLACFQAEFPPSTSHPTV